MKKLYILVFVFSLFSSYVSAQLVHPGASHKLSDLDRMKYMVESGIEPWATSFDNMSRQGSASFNYSVNGDPSITTITNLRTFENDGNAAYYNALMWYITGDERHAQKSVEIFNAWANITRIENQFALSNGGALWRMVEAAEIIKHTSSEWSNQDQQRFSDMLVYPGWSGTSVPTQAIANRDVSFYWNIYQGDPARHGNQGLFAYRSLMAMGIFLDNEVIYERALRYLRGQNHRADDLPYPSGPPVTTHLSSACEFFDEFSQTSRENRIEDYGYNEVLENYIWESGQSQESSRDQAHSLGGISIISGLSEMAWNQGDDLYGHLDNRLLLGFEFFYRYNLSAEVSYPDQPSPWEPTVESGEFIARTDRTGRWHSLKINPFVNCNVTVSRGGELLLQPVPEQNLAHYRDRLLLNANNYTWLQRAHNHITSEIGVENGDNPGSHTGFGGLKFRRVSPGDPISGFDNDGLPVFAMNVLPMTIEAENFDYFTANGNGRTYSDTTNGNTGQQYRNDQSVDIQQRNGGGHNIGWIMNGEWLTYTVYVPETNNYNISINYAGFNPGAQIRIEVNGNDISGNVALPETGGSQNWEDIAIADNVPLTQGVQQLKVLATGTHSSFNLNSISITENDAQPPTGTAVHIKKRNAQGFAIDGNHGAENGQNLYIWSESSNNVNQQWIEINRGGGFYSYQKSGTNHCIDGGNGGADRQNVYLWQCGDNNQNQHWQKVATDSGFFKLVKRNAPGFALNGGSAGANGQNVNLFDSTLTSHNLQWSID